LAKVTDPNQFSLAVVHRTTAKVDDCSRVVWVHAHSIQYINSSSWNWCCSALWVMKVWYLLSWLFSLLLL